MNGYIMNNCFVNVFNKAHALIILQKQFTVSFIKQNTSHFLPYSLHLRVIYSKVYTETTSCMISKSSFWKWSTCFTRIYVTFTPLAARQLMQKIGIPLTNIILNDIYAM